MRTRLFSVVCGVALVGLLSADAFAQPGQGRGMGRGMFSRAMLLMTQEVQDELELSDRQREELMDILGDLRGGPGGPGGQRGEGQRGEGQRGEGRRGEGGERGQAMREAEAKALKVLDEDQRDRLLGIFMWVAGANAYTDADVISRVGISDDVKEEIAEVVQAGMQEMGDIMREMRESGDDMQTIMDAMRKHREELEKEVIGLLSKEQQDTVAKLKGKRFELEMFGRGRGRGG